jgi:SAM-dependent methyltransferase
MDRDRHVEEPRGVFDASADEYVHAIGTELGPATEDVVDLSMLDAFAQLAHASGSGVVADLGCGPGRAASHLARLHLAVVGIDISFELLSRGRTAHAEIPVAQARLDELPFGDGALIAAVCWYSIIFTPPQLLGAVTDELARALRAQGPVLMAFQAGASDAVVTPDARSTGISLTSYRHDAHDVCDRLATSGFEVHATARRSRSLPHESTDQAFVIARRR